MLSREISDFLWFGSSIIGIILILLLTYFGSRWLVKRMSGSASGQNIKILDRAFLGQDKYVAIVKVGTKHLLIGVTSHEISRLCELGDEDGLIFPEPASMDNNRFKDVLEHSIERLSEKHRRNKDHE